MKKLILLLVIASCKSTPIQKIDSSFLPCEYTTFWWAVMMAESGGNPKTVYHESFGLDSLGLYQISFEDAARYNCPFKKREDTFNPDLNTICKDLIEDKLKAKYPEENWSKSLGRYWSSLRRKEDWGKDYPGYLNFKKFAAQRGCVIQ